MSVLENPRIGAAALVAGGALTWASWGMGYGTGVTAAGAVALGGGVQGLVGLALWQRERRRLQAGRGAFWSDPDIEVLLRAMVAVAAIDGRFEAREMAIIEDVSSGLLGASLSRARIERAYRQMRGRRAIGQLARKAGQATPEAAELAVKGAVWTGRADGPLTGAETATIAAIAESLGIGGPRLRQCIAEADHVHDRLAALNEAGES